MDSELCNFCGCKRELVARGPEVAICSVCVTAMIGTNARGEGGNCSFCGKVERFSRLPWRDRRIVAVGAAGGARICSKCLSIARGVIEHLARV